MLVQVEDGAGRHPQGLHRAAEGALPAGAVRQVTPTMGCVNIILRL